MVPLKAAVTGKPQRRGYWGPETKSFQNGKEAMYPS